MEVPKRFEGRVVLVTGVGTGSGLATAVRFGAEGAKVVVAARSPDHVSTASSMLEGLKIPHRALRADVATEEGAARVVTEAVSAFGGIDVLVNTAGGYLPGKFEETTIEQLETMLSTNLRTGFLCAKAAVPEIAKRGRGAVVIVGAVFGGLVPGPGLLAYNTSKAASAGMVQSLAGELAPRNVRVNAILPGGISHHFEPDRDVSEGRVLLRGPAEPEDIAAAAAFLASDEACWITGAALVVDGGFSVSRRLF